MTGEASVEAVANCAGGACCHAAKGPGYATPLEAMEKPPREKLIYVTCIYNGAYVVVASSVLVMCLVGQNSLA
jgi:methanethiol oxidase